LRCEANNEEEAFL
jgi:hypothetical protein